jgi:hypothetical protein
MRALTLGLRGMGSLCSKPIKQWKVLEFFDSKARYGQVSILSIIQRGK